MFVLFLLLSVILVLFFCSAVFPPLKNICRMTTKTEISVKVSPQDSAKYASYSSRLDSIQNVLADVRDQYQDDINIGIDRLNSWVGFWLAVLTFVLLIAGVWQYLQAKQYDEEWKEQKEDLKTEKDKIQQEIKAIEELKKEWSLWKDRNRAENAIFNLLRTMGAVHDPMMFLQVDNRKQIILAYLERIQVFLLRYADLRSKGAANEDETDDSLIYELILVNLRITVCRSKPLFTSPSANVRIITFLDYVEKEEKNFRETKCVDDNFFQNINKEIGSLVECLKLGVA